MSKREKQPEAETSQPGKIKVMVRPDYKGRVKIAGEEVQKGRRGAATFALPGQWLWISPADLVLDQARSRRVYMTAEELADKERAADKPKQVHDSSLFKQLRQAAIERRKASFEAAKRGAELAAAQVQAG